MSFTDPIGDMLTRMRNAQHARHDSCALPWSRIKEQICKLLKEEGYIANIEVSGEEHKDITVTFEKGKTLELKRISSPGRRIYRSTKDMKPVLSGYGIALVSTSQGIVTDKQAREKKVGGEVICTVSVA